MRLGILRTVLAAGLTVIAAAAFAQSTPAKTPVPPADLALILQPAPPVAPEAMIAWLHKQAADACDEASFKFWRDALEQLASWIYRQLVRATPDYDGNETADQALARGLSEALGTSAGDRFRTILEWTNYVNAVDAWKYVRGPDCPRTTPSTGQALLVPLPGQPALQPRTFQPDNDYKFVTGPTSQVPPAMSLFTPTIPGFKVATDSQKFCTYGDGVGTPVTASPVDTPLISDGPGAGAPPDTPGTAPPTGPQVASGPSETPTTTRPTPPPYVPSTPTFPHGGPGSLAGPLPPPTAAPGGPQVASGSTALSTTPGLDAFAKALGHLLCGDPPPMADQKFRIEIDPSTLTSLPPSCYRNNTVSTLRVIGTNLRSDTRWTVWDGVEGKSYLDLGTLSIERPEPPPGSKPDQSEQPRNAIDRQIDLIQEQFRSDTAKREAAQAAQAPASTTQTPTAPAPTPSTPAGAPAATQPPTATTPTRPTPPTSAATQPSAPQTPAATTQTPITPSTPQDDQITVTITFKADMTKVQEGQAALTPTPEARLGKLLADVPPVPGPAGTQATPTAQNAGAAQDPAMCSGAAGTSCKTTVSGPFLDAQGRRIMFHRGHPVSHYAGKPVPAFDSSGRFVLRDANGRPFVLDGQGRPVWYRPEFYGTPLPPLASAAAPTPQAAQTPTSAPTADAVAARTPSTSLTPDAKPLGTVASNPLQASIDVAVSENSGGVIETTGSNTKPSLTVPEGTTITTQEFKVGDRTFLRVGFSQPLGLNQTPIENLVQLNGGKIKIDFCFDEAPAGGHAIASSVLNRELPAAAIKLHRSVRAGSSTR